jgi:DNA-directed RNA polymerase subunit RPC12/RpoP
VSLLRIYLTNESYPELRGVRRGWTRSATWWRAIDHAARHARFWVFAVTQASILAVLIAVNWMLVEWHVVQIAIALFAFAVFSYLQTTWGGDMMRSHLRAVSDIARYACPSCGQSLYGHIEDEGPQITCPECGARVDRAILKPPYRTPRQFRAFLR